MTYLKFNSFNPTVLQKISTLFLFRYEFPKDFRKNCIEIGLTSDDEIKSCLAAVEFRETCASNNNTAFYESLGPLYVKDFFDSDILRISISRISYYFIP